MHSEEQLINRISKAIPAQRAAVFGKSSETGLRLAIGDDSAVVAPGGTTDWIISCDAFLQDVHFFLDRHPADSVGYKALVRAASDLAAMGATPKLFLLTLALPSTQTGSWLNEFLKGMGRAARQLGMQLAGGDTAKFPAVSISVTVLGEIPRGAAVTRSGAKSGDLIYVSGTLGRAQLGLELVRKVGTKKSYRRLLQRHLYPTIHVKLGAWLAQNRVASAMMDISDGLSSDLRRLCKASRVGARLVVGKIPCVEVPFEAQKLLQKTNLDPLEMALHGGDDYELLFTVPPNKLNFLREAPGFAELSAIGEITHNQNLVILLSNGRPQPLRTLGWDPFRRK